MVDKQRSLRSHIFSGPPFQCSGCTGAATPEKNECIEGGGGGLHTKYAKMGTQWQIEIENGGMQSGNSHDQESQCPLAKNEEKQYA